MTATTNPAKTGAVPLPLLLLVGLCLVGLGAAMAAAQWPVDPAMCRVGEDCGDRAGAIVGLVLAHIGGLVTLVPTIAYGIRLAR